jgi:hypothetical protein
MSSAIVLNRMYVGDYLASNLGHEVINLYQADNGGNYIYLNSTGDFVKAHQGQVNTMLFVKYYGVGEVEVIGLAKGLQDVYQADQKFADKYNGPNKKIYTQQQEYIISEGGITYGGVSILDIFGEAGQQSVYITYKAEKVYIPKEGKRLFIRFHSEKEVTSPKHEASDIVVELKGYQQAKASLKQYIYAEGTYSGDLAKRNVSAKRDDYDKINKRLVNDATLWQESNNQVDEEELNTVSYRKISLFDICQIQNDENKFSNAISFFMMQYPMLWRNFFLRYSIDLGETFTVSREEASKIEDSNYDHTNNLSGGRIDLMLRTNNAIVVIENKIKSDINSIEDDCEGKQLRRYYNYATWLSDNKNGSDYKKEKHFFILTPKYNLPTIEDEEMKNIYTIITYADVYKYLTENYNAIKNDANFVAFYDAMYRHTLENVNDYLYYEMQEKFFRRIKKLR